MRVCLNLLVALGIVSCAADDETLLDQSCPWYRDADDDGTGAGDVVAHGSCTTVEEGYSISASDCDDQDPNVYDFNHVDKDGDGVGSAEVACKAFEWVTQTSLGNWDCDDNDPTVSERFYLDTDGDGFVGAISQCAPWYGVSGDHWYRDGLRRSDCDDADPSVGAAAKYLDADGDGYGAGEPSCAGTSSDDSDCDDNDASLHALVYVDADGDGFGGYNTSCQALSDGYATDWNDCDDSNPESGFASYRDEDGDGVGSWVSACETVLFADFGDCADDDASAYQWGYVDSDGDGIGSGTRVCGDASLVELGSDCDDDDPTVWALRYTDADGDGWGTGEASCATEATGAAQAGDCDDAAADGLSEGACERVLSTDYVTVAEISKPCADRPTLVLQVVTSHDEGKYVVSNSGDVDFDGTLTLTRRDATMTPYGISSYSLRLVVGEATVLLLEQGVTMYDAVISSPDTELCNRSVLHDATFGSTEAS